MTKIGLFKIGYKAISMISLWRFWGVGFPSPARTGLVMFESLGQ